MRAATRLILALAAGIASGAVLAGSLTPAERDASKLGAALVAKDYLAVAALTHPAVVKGAGGPEGVAKLLRDANAALTINSMKFGKPQQVREIAGTQIAVFPFRSNVTLDKKTVEFDSFYIGFSADRNNWTFIDCEGVTQAYLAALLPGYKDDLILNGC